MVAAVARPQALSKRHPSLALVLAGCVAVFGFCPTAPSFVFGQPPSAAAVGVARQAEPVKLEEPPSDEELGGARGEYTDIDMKPEDVYIEPRWRPGTTEYRLRERKEEAERLRPIIEPLLLNKQLTLRELTFVLNRQGHKLRHLLWRPRMGLPVFTEHQVHKTMKKTTAVTAKWGLKLHKYVRPADIPPFAPAAYRGVPKTVNYAFIESTYAEVPPMDPLSEETLEKWKKIEDDDPVFEKYGRKQETVPVDVMTMDQAEEMAHPRAPKTGIKKIDFMNKVRTGSWFHYHGDTEDIHKAEMERMMEKIERRRARAKAKRINEFGYDPEDEEDDDETDE